MSQDTNSGADRMSLDEILVSLLHKYDHEPDEITKYVVIDQTEFVPAVKQAIIGLIDSTKPQKLLEKKKNAAMMLTAQEFGFNQAIDLWDAGLRGALGRNK